MPDGELQQKRVILCQCVGVFGADGLLVAVASLPVDLCALGGSGLLIAVASLSVDLCAHGGDDLLIAIISVLVDLCTHGSDTLFSHLRCGMR